MPIAAISTSVPASGDRSLCGWRVAGTLPLPDLPLWAGDGRPPDLTIELGRVPEALEGPAVALPSLQIAGDGTCRFAVPDVAAYLIDPGGSRVVVDPVLSADAPEVRVFLLGTVLGILCGRRGLLPLHASCVRVGDRAVALAGRSGIGKSTLAATLLRRGHALLADDVTVVDTAAPDGPRVLPAVPRLKLWHDALTRLEIPAGGLERSHATLDKFHLPVGDAFCTEPLPLTAVFHLDAGEAGEAGRLRRLHGSEAVARLGRDLYRHRLLMWLGLTHRLLPASAAVAAVPGGTWDLAHGHRAGGLDRSVAAILERLTA